MPLQQGKSKSVLAKNIKRLIKEGHFTHEQAVAIALDKANKKEDNKA